MQDPDSPPKVMRTCPSCKRQVEPGFKFCETCGTRIPELLTCSKCGTQFITPLKYCDLCGTRLIPEKVEEPAGLPEPVEEENTGPVDDQAPEPDEVESAEPGPDAVPEDNDEETIEPAEVESHRHYTREIQEPDTDELLELYGKDYDPDETLESGHTSKPKSRINPDAKKPGTFFSHLMRESPGTVDDALLLSPEKPGTPVKLRGNKIRIIGGCIALVVIIAAVYFIGLPMLSGIGGFGDQSNQPSAAIAPPPEPAIAGTLTPTPAPTPTPASGALVPEPTQTLPTGQKLYFHVQKSPITAKILVTFSGSAGHGSIKSADITVTHPDGSVATGIILPLKGVTEIILDGSKATDRVEIVALMSDGETYRVYDALVPLVT